MSTNTSSGLSRRGTLYASPENNNALLAILRDAWEPVSNPDGFLSLGVAENVRPALLQLQKRNINCGNANGPIDPYAR